MFGIADVRLKCRELTEVDRVLLSWDALWGRLRQTIGGKCDKDWIGVKHVRLWGAPVIHLEDQSCSEIGHIDPFVLGNLFFGSADLDSWVQGKPL